MVVVEEKNQKALKRPSRVPFEKFENCLHTGLR
jgi:hypothetical protein